MSRLRGVLRRWRASAPRPVLDGVPEEWHPGSTVVLSDLVRPLSGIMPGFAPARMIAGVGRMTVGELDVLRLHFAGGDGFLQYSRPAFLPRWMADRCRIFLREQAIRSGDERLDWEAIHQDRTAGPLGNDQFEVVHGDGNPVRYGRIWSPTPGETVLREAHEEIIDGAGHLGHVHHRMMLFGRDLPGSKQELLMTDLVEEAGQTALHIFIGGEFDGRLASYAPPRPVTRDP